MEVKFSGTKKILKKVASELENRYQVYEMRIEPSHPDTTYVLIFEWDIQRMPVTRIRAWVDGFIVGTERGEREISFERLCQHNLEQTVKENSALKGG
jgi:hypothetical protein